MGNLWNKEWENKVRISYNNITFKDLGQQGIHSKFIKIIYANHSQHLYMYI